MTLVPFRRRRPTRRGKHCWGTCQPRCADCNIATREQATWHATRSYSIHSRTA